MKRMKSIALACLLASCMPAIAQTIDLEKRDTLTWRDTTQLKTKYTYARAKAKYPAWVGYMEYKGASSKVLNYYEPYVSFQNALWENDNGIGRTNYADGLSSRANVLLPNALMKFNDVAFFGQGTVWGQGTAEFNQPQYNQAAGGTTIVIDRATWQGKPNTFAAFQSSLWGVQGVYSYQESAHIYNLSIYGGAGSAYDPNVKESGIKAWRCGEQSCFGFIFVRQCNDYGIEFAGGDHATASLDHVSTFLNNLGGVGIIGGGKITTHMVKGDENPALFVILPDSTGGIGNGTILKAYDNSIETGHVVGRPVSKGGMLLDARGYFHATFFGVSYTCVNSLPECLTRCEATTSNPCRLDVYGLDDFYLCHTIVHDPGTNMRYVFDRQFNTPVTEFHYTTGGPYSDNSGIVTPPLTNTCDNRLAPLPRDPMTGGPLNGAAWNYTAGTPAYSYTSAMIPGEVGYVPPNNPPPPTCTSWAVTDSSVCSNGVKLFTVVPMPANCTGTPPGTKPPTSKPCSITPPPPGKMIAAYEFTAGSAANITAEKGPNLVATYPGTMANGILNVSAATCYPLSLSGIVKVVMKFTPSVITSQSYGRLFNGLNLEPDGYWHYNGVKCTSTQSSAMMVGTPYSITIILPQTFPQGVTIATLFQGMCGQGGAQQGAWDRLEFWSN